MAHHSSFHFPLVGAWEVDQVENRCRGLHDGIKQLYSTRVAGDAKEPIGGLFLEHVALTVSDLERSITFYRDVMGLILKRVVEAPPEKRLGDINGLPGCSARIAHLYSGDFMLELFEFLHPKGDPTPRKRTQADVGLVHIGFRTSNIHADSAELKELGVELFGDPVEFRPGVWVVYFFGPDGEVCELRQI